MTSEIDRFPVKNLPDRYDINRSVLYTRLNKLGIRPVKNKNQSFITGEELKLLDKLDAHLKNGGNTPEFLEQTDNPTDASDRQQVSPEYRGLDTRQDAKDIQETQTGHSEIQGAFEELLLAALEAIENRRKGLNDLRDLEEIAANNWHIPSSRLADIIGKSRAYFTGKTNISYCGFRLKKVGKQGHQSLWRVVKDSPH